MRGVGRACAVESIVVVQSEDVAGQVARTVETKGLGRVFSGQ